MRTLAALALFSTLFLASCDRPPTVRIDYAPPSTPSAGQEST